MPGVPDRSGRVASLPEVAPRCSKATASGRSGSTRVSAESWAGRRPFALAFTIRKAC
jgi:hypothetical protein